MNLLHQNSLASTLDAVNDIYFYGKSMLKKQREEVAAWIAGRQGKPKAYAGMFAPTETDYKKGIRLFTGEKITSAAAIGHILGEEACRALSLLEVDSTGVGEALARAQKGIMERIAASETEGTKMGMFCCGTCSVALWRHLAASELDGSEKRLRAGLKILKEHRSKDGRWKRFPFYYTLLALSELDLKPARDEMKYAAPACERILKKIPQDDELSHRRYRLAQRILSY